LWCQAENQATLIITREPRIAAYADWIVFLDDGEVDALATLRYTGCEVRDLSVGSAETPTG
jgi:hypothetical protein